MGHPSRAQGFSETGKGGRGDRLAASEENKHRPLAKFCLAKVQMSQYILLRCMVNPSLEVYYML